MLGVRARTYRTPKLQSQYPSSRISDFRFTVWGSGFAEGHIHLPDDLIRRDGVQEDSEGLRLKERPGGREAG